MSPEYVLKGVFSVKSDVYSFGVLLLETVSGSKISSVHLKADFSSIIAYVSKMTCSNFCKYRKYMHLERVKNGCRHGAYGRMGTHRILLTRQLWGAAHLMKLHGASISDSYVFKAAQMRGHSCHQSCPSWRMEIYPFQLQKSPCILQKITMVLMEQQKILRSLQIT